MKNKIYDLVKAGSGPLHLLSVVEKENKVSNIHNSRKSELFKTKNLVLDPFYKSAL